MASPDPLELLPADADVDLDTELQVGLLTSDDADPDDVEPLPFGRSWAFDFEAGQFLRHGASPAIIYGLDTLRSWVEKTLHTARGAHPIYSDDYGTDAPYEGIGEPFTSEAAGTLTTSITDALLVHDRITDVTDFRFTGDLDSEMMFVDFTVVTDDEEVEFNSLPLGESF